MKNRNGFTLIELLVVVAILSLLVSILLPSLKQAKELAAFAKCAAHLKGIGTAMALYSGEYNTRAMKVNSNPLNGMDCSWQGVLGELYLGGSASDGQHFLPELRCRVGKGNAATYVMNNYVGTAPYVRGWGGVAAPYKMIVAADGGWWWTGSGYYYWLYFSSNRWKDGYKYRHLGPADDPLEQQGRLNGLFADWHVEGFTDQDGVITTPHETCRAMNPYWPDDYCFGHPGGGGEQTP